MSNNSSPLPRQDQILGELHAHLRKRTQRKRAVRIALASTTGILALAAAAYLAIPPAPGTRSATELTNHQPTPRNATVDPVPAPAPTVVNRDSVSPHASSVTIRIAKSEPIPTTPCETGPAATLCILNDDQLLAALAEAGQPSGLIRTGGTAYIVPTSPSQLRR